MEQIGSFFEKIKKNISYDLDLKKEIVFLIKENTGIEVLEKNITLKNGLLYISEKPILKNEIKIKKEKILSSFKDRIKNRKIKDIL